MNENRVNMKHLRKVTERGKRSTGSKTDSLSLCARNKYRMDRSEIEPGPLRWADEKPELWHGPSVYAYVFLRKDSRLKTAFCKHLLKVSLSLFWKKLSLPFIRNVEKFPHTTHTFTGRGHAVPPAHSQTLAVDIQWAETPLAVHWTKQSH
jgi:hypothetical protein